MTKKLDPKNSFPKKNTKYVGDIGVYINMIFKIGLTMVCSLICFLGIGIYIEKKMQWGGVALITCVLIGIGVGFYYLYCQMKDNFKV